MRNMKIISKMALLGHFARYDNLEAYERLDNYSLNFALRLGAGNRKIGKFTEVNAYFSILP